MEEKIIELEKRSRELEPGLKDREVLQQKANSYSNHFIDQLPDEPAYKAYEKESVNKLLNDPITEDGADTDDVLSIFSEQVVPPGLNLSSGRHFGYIPGGGLSTSAVGDYLAAITNRYAGVYSSSPGAVALETRMINWLKNLFGYPDSSGGYLSSGGSHANLTAIVAARDSKKLKGADYSRAVIYITEQTHHCVDRALNIAGMSECVRQKIPMDNSFRMRTSFLAQAIQKDKEDGLMPWLIVASAGSTDAGVVDPLDEIGPIARKYNLWFHVDAAYGGFFMLTQKGAGTLKGISESDSLVVDPHKGMFLPYGIGALLVKDPKILSWAHRFEASYMNDTKVDSGIYSPAEISPELSKHFRAVRMWLPLKLHGVAPFRAALEEKLLLTGMLWKKLSDTEQIVTGPKPQLSVVMFRWEPFEDSSANDEINKKLHKLFLEDGRVFLSVTTINGRFYFRAAILSARTHLADIHLLLKVLSEKMDSLREG
ncbi:MAG: aminotransferase class I/II-fold pyridoxal phosphate-dependent enzyme [Balneolaceae bacterium]|nr:MAG: aminotransferase class I/II-fold pyridoxal phosphate-dependent enzyme [Balneolaceae bacterium]